MPIKTDKKIITMAWIYGAFFGLMPPYVFTLITIGTVDNFRAVYYLRLVLAIVIGALAGGFSSALLTKLSLKIIRKYNVGICIVLGFLLGSVAGAVTLGFTPLVFLISSTDINWALTTIFRTAMAGLLMGSVAGAFLGGLLHTYLREE
jgi:hypothetical protein